MNPSGFDALVAAGLDYLNVVVSRNDIQACDIREVAGTLPQLVQTRDRLYRFRHRVSLFIDGYNSDTRELYEIPEVRAYMVALDEEFPYWFWFLNSRDSSLLIVAASCCDLQAHRTTSMGYVSIEPIALANFQLRHFDALNRLADVHGIPEDTLAQVSSSSASTLVPPAKARRSRRSMRECLLPGVYCRMISSLNGIMRARLTYISLKRW